MIITADGFRDRFGRREFVGLAAGAFVVAVVHGSRRRPSGPVLRSVPVMGTVAQFAVVHRDPVVAHAAIDAAIAELRWVEQTMTRFTATSDVGRANRLAMRDAVPVTRETLCVVEEALRWADATDGGYDPALGALSALWDVRRRREPPPEGQVRELAGRRFHRGIEAGAFRGTPVLRYHLADARLDLGSIAKGYGVDRAIGALRRHGIASAVVATGGDLYALGGAPDGEAWSVGVQSPSDPDGIIGTLRVRDCAVATSGTYRQFFRHGGRTYHHILDPATGSPRETTMRSLTIVADTVMQADAATTALFGLAEERITHELARNASGARLAHMA